MAAGMQTETSKVKVKPAVRREAGRGLKRTAAQMQLVCKKRFKQVSDPIWACIKLNLPIMGS